MNARVRRFMLARRGSLSLCLRSSSVRNPRSAGSTFSKTVADRLTDNGRRFAHVLKPWIIFSLSSFVRSFVRSFFGRLPPSTDLAIAIETIWMSNEQRIIHGFFCFSETESRDRRAGRQESRNLAAKPPHGFMLKTSNKGTGRH